ncbi:MAG TPA: hypothetical protein VEO18_05995 [Thermoplasmata archaeon]|nr:hypothetical protein [Thermoplasmata archaeon]
MTSLEERKVKALEVLAEFAKKSYVSLEDVAGALDSSHETRTIGEALNRIADALTDSDGRNLLEDIRDGIDSVKNRLVEVSTALAGATPDPDLMVATVGGIARAMEQADSRIDELRTETRRAARSLRKARGEADPVLSKERAEQADREIDRVLEGD